MLCLEVWAANLAAVKHLKLFKGRDNLERLIYPPLILRITPHSPGVLLWNTP